MEKSLTIINNNGQCVIESREVAEVINKEHSHLMRDIKGYSKILGESNFGLANFFIESEYVDSQGKKRPCYLLTKKGCDMVANKMTGEKGVLFTAAYVTKFDEMKQRIKEQQIKVPMTYRDAIAELLRVEDERLLLEQRVAEYEPKITYLDTILECQEAITVTQIAADYGMSASKLNRTLADEGIQWKVGGQWILKGSYKEQGYTKSHTQLDGQGKPRLNTKWTQKGRLFIHNLLEKKGIKAIMDYEV